LLRGKFAKRNREGTALIKRSHVLIGVAVASLVGSSASYLLGKASDRAVARAYEADVVSVYARCIKSVVYGKPADGLKVEISTLDPDLRIKTDFGIYRGSEGPPTLTVSYDGPLGRHTTHINAKGQSTSLQPYPYNTSEFAKILRAPFAVQDIELALMGCVQDNAPPTPPKVSVPYPPHRGPVVPARFQQKTL
jgi:hypothetical protein